MKLRLKELAKKWYNENERITFCEREETKEALCIIFIILLIFFGYIIYISV